MKALTSPDSISVTIAIAATVTISVSAQVTSSYSIALLAKAFGAPLTIAYDRMYILTRLADDIVAVLTIGVSAIATSVDAALFTLHFMADAAFVIRKFSTRDTKRKATALTFTQALTVIA